MTSRHALAAAILLAATFAPTPFAASPAAAADAAVTQPKPGWHHRLVKADFVAQYAVLPKPEGVQIIDSRPTARKYDPGHIPTALSIPDSQFEKLADLLPKDKGTLLIFYCDGVDCMLSHNSAFKAERLGYTNVHVYAEGYPDWIASGHASAVSAPIAKKLTDENGKPAIQAGKESGTIAVASFERIYREAADTIHLIDVREPQEFAAGTFRGATNFPISSLEKRIDELPGDKPIVFFCGAGGRSGEAHDMAKLYRPQLKTYFLDADIKWRQDGSYTLAEKK